MSEKIITTNNLSKISSIFKSEVPLYIQDHFEDFNDGDKKFVESIHFKNSSISDNPTDINSENYSVNTLIENNEFPSVTIGDPDSSYEDSNETTMTFTNVKNPIIKFYFHNTYGLRGDAGISPDYNETNSAEGARGDIGKSYSIKKYFIFSSSCYSDVLFVNPDVFK